MRNVLKYSAVAVVAIAIGIQFIRSERTNPPIDPAKDIVGRPYLPANVQAVLERSCFDCHSNRSRWPWYSEVAPASWLVTGDVNEAREHLNFSEWEGYKVGRRLSKLESLMNMLDKGTMPPMTYLMMHGNAVLSAAEKDLVSGWAEDLSDSLAATSQQPKNGGIRN
jgi:hypothetical protein